MVLCPRNINEGSYLDVLVVVDQSMEKPYRRSVMGIRALRGLKINEDIIVPTKKEFEELSQDVTTLCLAPAPCAGTRR